MQIVCMQLLNICVIAIRIFGELLKNEIKIEYYNELLCLASILYPQEHVPVSQEGIGIVGTLILEQNEIHLNSNYLLFHLLKQFLG